MFATDPLMAGSKARSGGVNRFSGHSKYADGEHYFDTLADDVLFEFSLPDAGLAGVDTRSGRPHVALLRVRQQHFA